MNAPECSIIFVFISCILWSITPFGFYYLTKDKQKRIKRARIAFTVLSIIFIFSMIICICTIITSFVFSLL
jgi:hypothetical protein